MRRASAVVARFLPLFAARRSAQTFSQFIFLVPFSIDVAAWKSAVRRAASPILVIPPDTSRSPDWLRFGVSPAQTPMSLALRNRTGSSTAVTKASALTGPVPGIVISRRHVSADMARLLILFAVMAGSSRICLRSRWTGATASDSIALTEASSRTLSSQRPFDTRPSFRPKLRRMPRYESSSRMMPSTSALRERRRARFSRDATDLQWTGWNQPIRTKCSMPCRRRFKTA